MATAFPKMSAAMEHALVGIISNRRKYRETNGRTCDALEARGYLRPSRHSWAMPRMIISDLAAKWWAENGDRHPGVAMDDPRPEAKRRDEVKVWLADFERIRDDMPQMRWGGGQQRAEYLASYVSRWLERKPAHIKSA